MDDIPDSTDWLGTALAGLMPLEQALRCHVCKDLYTSPMLTSCNHTFCSLCIRRCLAVDGKCPLCRMGDQESKLRGNWALREAVEAFCRARPALLGVARRQQQQQQQQQQAAGAKEPVARRPKRRQDTAEDAPEENADAKRTRSSARLSKTRAAEAVAALATAQRQEVVASEDDDDDDDDGLVVEAEDKDDAYEPDDGLVACPICWARMRPLLVDRHLDTTCPGGPSQPAAQPRTMTTTTTTTTMTTTTPWLPRATTASPPERLPSVSYSLLSDTALRKKLAQLGLATTGPRPLLERRHREWTTLWNANCDAARPKHKAALLHDLEVWERAQGGGSTGAGLSFGSRASAGPPIKEKDFDGAAWSARHSTAFKDLVASARRSAGGKAGGEAGDAKGEQSKGTEEPSGLPPPPPLDDATLRGPVVKAGGEGQRAKEGPAGLGTEAVDGTGRTTTTDDVEVVATP